MEKLLKKYDIPIETNVLRSKAASCSDESIKEAPIIVISNEDGVNMIDYVQNLQGEDLKKYIVRIVDTLKIAEQQTKPGALAAQVYSCGILAVGATWGAAVAVSYLSGAVGLQAMIGGLFAVTVSVVISAIVIGLLVVFIPFLIYMEKKAEILGFILNRTKTPLVLSDSNMYFNHGHLIAKSNVEDLKHLPNKLFSPAGEHTKVKLQDGTWYEYELANIGMFYATKINYALIGVEGAFKFEFLNGNERFPNGVYLGFSVPLSSGKNKCYISWDNFSSPHEFYDENYGDFITDYTKSDSERVIHVCLNSSGGEWVLHDCFYSR